MEESIGAVLHSFCFMTSHRFDASRIGLTSFDFHTYTLSGVPNPLGVRRALLVPGRGAENYLLERMHYVDRAPSALQGEDDG